MKFAGGSILREGDTLETSRYNSNKAGFLRWRAEVGNSLGSITRVVRRVADLAEYICIVQKNFFEAMK